MKHLQVARQSNSMSPSRCARTNLVRPYIEFQKTQSTPFTGWSSTSSAPQTGRIYYNITLLFEVTKCR